MDQRKYSTEKPNSKIIIKFLLASMITLTNFKDWSRSRIKISVVASFSVVNFLQCPPSLDVESAKIYMSYDIGGFQCDILGPQAAS